MSSSAIIDTSYRKALVDEHDSLHGCAIPLRVWLQSHEVRLVFLDIMIAECISVLARRCAERKRTETLAPILTTLERLIPLDSITWVGHEIRRHYVEILRDVRETDGRRNFNDALTILVARDIRAAVIISFDPDFDGVTGLTRVHNPETAHQVWSA